MRDLLQALLREATAAVKTVEGFTSAEDLLEAPQGARRAYLSIQRLGADYVALRNAFSRLRALLSPCEHDTGGIFLELAGLPSVWPDYKRGRNQPWPSEAGARLRWLVEHPEAEPWLPLPAEQDQRWWQEFGEAIERQRSNRVAAHAALGVGL